MKSCFHTDIGMAGMDINSLEALLSSSPLQFLEVLSPEDFLSGVFCGTCSVKELLADSILMLLILRNQRFKTKATTQTLQQFWYSMDFCGKICGFDNRNRSNQS